MIDQQLINIKRVLKSVTKSFLNCTYVKGIFRSRFLFENVFSVNYVTQNGGGV